MEPDLIREFISLCQLNHTVKHQYAPVLCRLEDQYVLELGPLLAENPCLVYLQ